MTKPAITEGQWTFRPVDDSPWSLLEIVNTETGAALPRLAHDVTDARRICWEAVRDSQTRITVASAGPGRAQQTRRHRN